jgi:threonine dehydrogenase-like Zn-dependent dehydrogenase
VQAFGIFPRKPDSGHLVDLPDPSLAEIPGGRGVLVRLLRCGVDGTDRELLAGEYGDPPPGYDFLVTGHENFGQVEAVGPNVTEVKPGDYVVATVRRPGTSIYDRLGMSDFTTDDVYYERGISHLHGFLTARYVDHADFVVKIPPELQDVAVLLEPFSIVQKGVAQAYEIQRRLKVWKPERALVMGAGSIGLLATLALRLRGVKVITLAKGAPKLNVDLASVLGATYASVDQLSIFDAAAQHGPFDLIFEATGYAPVAFDCMQVLGKNGVLVLASVTGGKHPITVPADKINEGFVLGNKVMVGTVNANRSYFEAGVKDMALASEMYPGWLARLITKRIAGLAQWPDLAATLKQPGQIKVVVELS